MLITAEKDQVLSTILGEAEITVPVTEPWNVVLRVIGDELHVDRERPEPCDVKPVPESQFLPLDHELCRDPARVRDALELVEVRLMAEGADSALSAADWNNVGCLFAWQRETDWVQARAYCERAQDGAGFIELPERAQEIILQNVARAIRATKKPDPDLVIIQPWNMVKAELGADTLEQLAAGQIEGIRLEAADEADLVGFGDPGGAVGL